ncbi:MAG: DsrE/DsrF/DrsH-like family protein [Aigarchaeota archaeon]|nr:DsrE/DsrF/DrsH-like family protein [Candidatus Pelearchaeum maunauluense]
MGSAVMGAKAFVYCTMDGLSIVRKGEVEKIQLEGAPPLSKLVEDAKNAGVKFVACAPSKEMLQQMGITAETVLQGVELEDVFGFLNNALPAARQGGIVLFV